MTPTWEDAAVETQKTLNLALRRITELEHLLASRDALKAEVERLRITLANLINAVDQVDCPSCEPRNKILDQQLEDCLYDSRRALAGGEP